MWVASLDGFYSAVVKPEDRESGIVTVRTRTQADARRLARLTGSKVHSTPWGDYPYRVRLTKDEWAGVVANWALDIDYDNFKDAATRHGTKRARAYMRTWSAMVELERRPWKRWLVEDDEAVKDEVLV